MPRDGLNQYAPPAGTNGTPNYTVESARYNVFVADITSDQNNPRPIVAGGTGASDARNAMINLSGEIAKQVVTNYDSFPWVNGSFYSAAGATSAPNSSNRFAGIYYGNADDSYATVEARDQTTGILYVRKKVAGVWDAVPAGWAAQAGAVTDLDAAYVNVAGDTMTGTLQLNGTTNASLITLNNTSAGATTPKKLLSLSATGTFQIINNAGAAALFTVADNGDVTVVNGKMTINGDVWAVRSATDGALFLGSNGGQYISAVSGVLSFTGGTTSYNFNSAGPVLITGALRVQNNANLGASSGLSIGASPKATAGSNGWFIQSNDAANSLYGYGYLMTDPTAGNRRLAINCTESGVAQRAITLNESGGNVGIGKSNPTVPLDVAGAVSIASGAGVTPLSVVGAAGHLYVDFNGGSINYYDANTHNFRSGPTTITSMQMTGTVINIPGTLTLNGGNFNLAGVSCAFNVGYAGGGTAYGMAMRPNADSTIAILFMNAAGTTVGSINQTSTNTSYATTSDERLKEDLKSFDAGNIIDNTNVYDFAWKSTGERSYGVIAQQAVDVYPAAVTYAKEQDWWGVDYSKYVPVLLQELKALRARVAELEGRFAARPA